MFSETDTRSLQLLKLLSAGCPDMLASPQQLLSTPAGCLSIAEHLSINMQEEQRDLAKTIRVSGSILLSTVSNFLDFFKMEAGKQLDVVRTEITTKVLLISNS